MSQNKTRPFGIDEEEYRQKKPETLEWLGQGAPGLDVGMLEILIQFNAIEGITTRWCCSGHVHEGQRNSDFYIMFTVNERGYWWLEEWFKLFMMRIGTMHLEMLHRVTLSKTYRLKRGDVFSEVVILKARGLKNVEDHDEFLYLVNSTFLIAG